MKFIVGKKYTARVKTEKEQPSDFGISNIKDYEDNIYDFVCISGGCPSMEFELVEGSAWAWDSSQLDFTLKKKEKREKKGFSIELHSKDSIENYTVYFETKNDKVIFCYIDDSFLNFKFRAKAICHKDDVFNKKLAYQLAFDRCLEKRDLMYERFLKVAVDRILTIQHNNINIENKFYKFLKSTN